MPAAQALDRLLLAPITAESFREYLYPDAKRASSFAYGWNARAEQLVLYYERVLELCERLRVNPNVKAWLSNLDELELAIPVHDHANLSDFRHVNIPQRLLRDQDSESVLLWSDLWVDDILNALALDSVIQVRLVAVYSCPDEQFSEGNMADRRFHVGLPPAAKWLTIESPADAEGMHETPDATDSVIPDIYDEGHLTPFSITDLVGGYNHVTVLRLDFNEHVGQESIMTPGLVQALSQCDKLQELRISVLAEMRWPMKSDVFEALQEASSLRLIDYRPFCDHKDPWYVLFPEKGRTLLPQVTRWRVPLLLASWILEGTKPSEELDLELYDYPFRQHQAEPHDWEDDYVKHALVNIQAIQSYLAHRIGIDRRQVRIIPTPPDCIMAFRVSSPTQDPLAQVGSHILGHQMDVIDEFIFRGLVNRDLYPQGGFGPLWMTHWSHGHEGSNVEDDLLERDNDRREENRRFMMESRVKM